MSSAHLYQSTQMQRAFRNVTNHKWILCVALVAYALLWYHTTRYSVTMVLRVGEPYTEKHSVLWRHILNKWKESSPETKVKMTKELSLLWRRTVTMDTDSGFVSSSDEMVAVVYEYLLVVKGFVPPIIAQATKEYLKTFDNMPQEIEQLENPLQTGHINGTFQGIPHRWNYNFAQLNNVSPILAQTLLFEYFRIQKRIFQKPAVQMMIIFNDDPQKYPTILDIIQNQCTEDEELLFELNRTVTRQGMKQLLRHMYGMQLWVNVKEKEMLKKFKHETYTFSVAFFFPSTKQDVKHCKYTIRKCVNDTNIFNAAHNPDDPDQSLILAQVLLNENSMHYLNHGDGCHVVAKELARRDKRPMITTYPKVHIGYKDKNVTNKNVTNKNVTDTSLAHIYFAREDIMLGPKAKAGFFSKNNKTQVVVDMIFLNVTHKKLYGDYENISVTDPAFVWNQSTLVDNFFDPRHHGYCYGLKFLNETKMLQNLTDMGKGEGALGGRELGQS